MLSEGKWTDSEVAEVSSWGIRWVREAATVSNGKKDSQDQNSQSMQVREDDLSAV
jgi:hypothetical protein